MAIKTLYPVTIGTDVLDGIIEATPDFGHRTTRPISDGLADPYFSAVISQAPRMAFTTLALAKGLALVGFESVVANVTMYDATRGDDGEFASGANHVKYVMASGITVPRTLNIPARGDASMSFETMGYSNSTTAPLTFTTAQSLGSYTPGSEELFGLGPVYINGSQITSLVGVSVDFGFSLQADMSDGVIWPKEVKVMSRLPVIRIRTSDSGNLVRALTASASNYRGALCLDGTNGLKLWAKKRACADGGYVADATAEHVLITALDGTVTVGPVTGPNRECVITVEPRRESTASVAIDTTAAIS